MIFVDTSDWLALADSHDTDHSRARAFSRRVARGEFGKQVTTNYVMTETITLIRRRLGLDNAASFAASISTSKEVRLFWIEPVHHSEAWELMVARTDKDWSSTDCTSSGVIRALNILDAFAFDEDFGQAGFTILP
jgi:predicted nucleic acid-binding protein